MADPFPRPRRVRIMQIVLVLSLALNVAVAGLALGVALRGHEGRPPRGFDLSLGPIGQALAPEDRAAIRDTLRNRGAGTGLRANRQDDLDRLVSVLTTEPFDPDALRAVVATPLDRVSNLQSDAVAALADRVAGMTADERAAFAARLQALRRR